MVAARAARDAFRHGLAIDDLISELKSIEETSE
jgi:hypothetical protein